MTGDTLGEAWPARGLSAGGRLILLILYPRNDALFPSLPLGRGWHTYHIEGVTSISGNPKWIFLNPQGRQPSPHLPYSPVLGFDLLQKLSGVLCILSMVAPQSDNCHYSSSVTELTNPSSIESKSPVSSPLTPPGFFFTCFFIEMFLEPMVVLDGSPLSVRSHPNPFPTGRRQQVVFSGKSPTVAIFWG